MKKHSAAIKQIRSTLKDLTGEKGKLRAYVLSIKFDEAGKRRPETGPDRHALKQDYNWRVRPDIRAHLLAYGFLRGIPYERMEPKAETGVQVSRILKAIHTAIGEDEALKAEWSLDRLLKLLAGGTETASEAA